MEKTIFVAIKQLLDIYYKRNARRVQTSKLKLKKMKKSYKEPRMEVMEVSVHTHILTLSDDVIGTKVEHDHPENTFTKKVHSHSLWDDQW